MRHAYCSPLPLTSKLQANTDMVNSKKIGHMQSNAETVEGMNEDVVGGDMILSRNRGQSGSHTWPHKGRQVYVPYAISPELVKRTGDITSALRIISEKTCVSFPKRTNERSYVEFVPSSGCASFIGFEGGKQAVYIGPLCRVGNIVHEVLHTLGFSHEHSRSDRDSYVKILTENIKEEKLDDFKAREISTLGLPYDITSIMHYGSMYFSKNGKPTIVAKMYNVQMGQRTYLTKYDVERVQRLYDCDSKTPK